MTDLISSYNYTLLKRYLPFARSGARRFDFMGGRRSTKTWTILQLLGGRMLRGETINVATMTAEQGRLGAYADMCDIIDGSPTIQPYIKILSSPREIRCTNGGRMFFNTYPDPERAKGVKCDWLYINEANNFTERQYIDLSASARRGVFADRNPNTKCWTEQHNFALIHSTWKDNQWLTDEQKKWFYGLKERAESPTATAADIYFYRVYYLGEYAEMSGNIFTPTNIQSTKELPKNLHDYNVFCDPSALRFADYFACVLAATDGEKLYIIDTYSRNDTNDIHVTKQLQQWCASYDVENVYIETNGIIGLNFFDFAINSGLPAMAWVSRGNKFERITANYQALTTKVVFLASANNEAYLQQIYSFAEKCDHDDNIDAVNSVYNTYKLNYLIQ